jgi:hypothetical protein
MMRGERGNPEGAKMALLTLEGIYREGRVELAETPANVGDETRVLVVFIPSETEVGRVEPGEEDDARAALLARIFERMEKGYHLGGAPYPNREELYDRVRRFGTRDD